jgi:hypothetical protein
MVSSSSPSSQSLEEGQRDPVVESLLEASAIVDKFAVRIDGMNVLVKPHRRCEVLTTLLKKQKRIGVPLDEICTAAAFASTYVYRLATCKHTILRKAAQNLLRTRPGYVCADSSVGDVARCLYVMCIVLAHRVSRRGLYEIDYADALSMFSKYSLRDAPAIEIQIGHALGWRLGPLLV